MIIKRNILFFIDKEGNLEQGYKPDGKLRLRIRFSSKKVDFNAIFWYTSGIIFYLVFSL